MKTDKLEQFIRDNRKNFGELEPNPDLWNKIERPEHKAKTLRFSMKTFLGRAAAVAAIFVAAYYFHDFRSKRMAEKSEKSTKNNPVYQEFIEAEFYYAAQISERKQELFLLTNDVPDIQKEVSGELNELDLEYQKLKEDLMDDANNQEVIEAMIQNFRIKLEILEEMLQQIKSKQHKNTIRDEENFS